jgi:prepilin-type N-terminal cleavage/methylation domain-containing protein
MKRRVHNFAGFTLIELVVAMAMVAVVAMSLYSTLHTSFRLQQSADSAVEPSDTIDIAMDLIGADLQNAVSPNTTITNAVNIYDVVNPSAANNTGSSSAGATGGMGGGAGIGTGGGAGGANSANAAPAGWVLAGPFEGTQAQGTGGMETDDLVLFTTADATPHVDGNGEIKMVELTIEQPQGSNEQCLVRRVTSDLTQEEPGKPDEEILCRGVTGFSLQYFDGSEWDPTWDSTQEDNTIPAAVQVTLNLSRPYNNGQTHTLTFTRVFPLSCSNAAMDSNVSTGNGL